jgi:hypothetical protein
MIVTWGHVGIVAGVAGAVGTVWAAWAAVLGLRSANETNRQLADERRSERQLELYRDMLSAISAAGVGGNSPQGAEGRAQARALLAFFRTDQLKGLRMVLNVDAPPGGVIDPNINGWDEASNDLAGLIRAERESAASKREP